MNYYQVLGGYLFNQSGLINKNVISLKIIFRALAQYLYFLTLSDFKNADRAAPVFRVGNSGHTAM
jgi:hypothetical protein